MNDDLVREAMTLDDKLDDIKRAQIWTRIDRAIDARPARAFRWYGVLALGACAAAAVAGWLVLRRAPEPVALVAPGESTLTARLGPHTRAQLIGPARLELEGAPGDAMRVRLREGALVAEFTGGPGRSLHIDAPGAAIDIVGTLFAVDVTRDGTCVSVAHGKVSVTAGAAKLAVGTGESWCSARPQIETLSPAARDRFDRFAAISVASAEPAPAAPVVAAAAPMPPVVDTPVVDTPIPAVPSAEIAAPERPRVDPSRVSASEPSSAVRSPGSAHVEAPSSEPPPREPPPREPPHVDAPPLPAAPVVPVVPAAPVAPVAPVAPAAKPVPAPVTAETLYRTAEAALGNHDLAGADRALGTLVTNFAGSPLVSEAIYERARIAYQRHAWSDARRQLELLAQDRASPLAEPGAYLACRIDVETHDEDAVRCLGEFRKAYPRSPHDLDVVGLLVDLAYRDGGCARAAPAIDELARSHPGAQLVKAWRSRCEAPR